MLKNAILLIGVMSGFLVASPVVAQSDSHNDYALASECLLETCQQALSAALLLLERRSLSEDQLNSRLGDLAVALFETARRADDARIRQQVSVAIVRIARLSSDRDQREAMLQVANDIRNGDGDLFDLADPVSISPS